MPSEELQKYFLAIAGSSAFTGAVIKLVEFALAEWKARREAARLAATPPKDGLTVATRTAGLVTPIIYHMLAEYNPDGNVGICELHNGDRFYSGRGIQRITMTAEACLVRGRGRQRDLQNVIMSAAQLNWIEELRVKKEPLYYADTLLLPAGFMKDYFEYYEIRSGYFTALFNPQNQMIGVLTMTSPNVDFLKGQPLTGIIQQIQPLQTFLTTDPA